MIRRARVELLSRQKANPDLTAHALATSATPALQNPETTFDNDYSISDNYQNMTTLS
jgi:hypothetical protein